MAKIPGGPGGGTTVPWLSVGTLEWNDQLPADKAGGTDSLSVEIRNDAFQPGLETEPYTCTSDGSLGAGLILEVERLGTVVGRKRVCDLPSDSPTTYPVRYELPDVFGSHQFKFVLRLDDHDETLAAEQTFGLAIEQPPGADNQPPHAEFDMRREGLVAEFDASASSDPDGQIERYLWRFGDGRRGEGEVVTHTYGQEGSFEATLTVVDNHGASDTTQRTVDDVEADRCDGNADCPPGKICFLGNCIGLPSNPTNWSPPSGGEWREIPQGKVLDEGDIIEHQYKLETGGFPLPDLFAGLIRNYLQLQATINEELPGDEEIEFLRIEMDDRGDGTFTYRVVYRVVHASPIAPIVVNIAVVAAAGALLAGGIALVLEKTRQLFTDAPAASGGLLLLGGAFLLSQQQNDNSRGG